MVHALNSLTSYCTPPFSHCQNAYAPFHTSLLLLICKRVYSSNFRLQRQVANCLEYVFFTNGWKSFWNQALLLAVQLFYWMNRSLGAALVQSRHLLSLEVKYNIFKLHLLLNSDNDTLLPPTTSNLHPLPQRALLILIQMESLSLHWREYEGWGIFRRCRLAALPSAKGGIWQRAPNQCGRHRWGCQAICWEYNT